MLDCIGAHRVLRCWVRIARVVPLLVLSVMLLALQPASAQFTRFQNYTDEQGLGDLTVTSVAQDEDGYILLGTQGGLYRYDGQGIASFDDTVGLPKGSWIRKVLCDDRGRTWVVTSDGIYLRHRSGFRRVALGVKVFKADNSHVLAAAGSSVVVDAGGTLLHASVGDDATGPFAPMFSPAAVAAIPRLATVSFVASDASGGFLFGCGDALCRAAADGSVSAMGPTAGLPADNWQTALHAVDGTVWVRSLNHLAWKKPGDVLFSVITVPGLRNTYFAGHPAELELASNGVGGVVTQADDGYLRWNGQSWLAYPHHGGGVPDGTILAFQIDREGSLWLGSTGYGAFRSLSAGVWEHWTKEDGLPANTVWAIVRLPGGKLWVAADGRSVPLDRSSSGVPGTNYVLAATRRGRFWLAPFGASLTRLDPERGTSEQFPSIGIVKGAVVDRNNHLWLTTSEAIFMIPEADASGAAATPRLVGPISGVLDVCTDEAGVTWIASPDGVFQWRMGDRGPSLVIPPDALSGSPFSAAFSPAGELWVATQSDGVLRFKLNRKGFVRLGSIVEPEIGSRDILLMHRDRRGRMWIGTDRGIDMFDGRSWRRFDGTDGPISNDISQEAVFEDEDGSLWFGTSHGLSHLLDPDHFPIPVPPHPLLITEVTLGGKAVPLQPAVSVPWIRGPLSIRFADLDYVGGRNMRFRYRIEGIDTAWNETSGRVIQYAAPPTGTLDFTLVAFDPTNNRRQTTITLRIRILAPWWRQQSLYWSSLIAFIILLAVTWRLRVRFLLRRQERLEAMIGARTQEIEQAREELYQRSTLEQQRLEEMVEIRTAQITEARNELQRLAMSDVLTGLPNRRAVMLALEAAAQDALSAGHPLAVLICDLDHFKSINDQHGHLVGDNVLSTFGERLCSILTPAEAAGRYGGEEFLVILHGDPTTASARAEAIRAHVTEASYCFGAVQHHVTISGGLALLRPNDNVVTLIARADIALYLAKENGRDRIELEQDETATHRQNQLASWKADLKRDLRAALDRDEFILHFQPVVDLTLDTVTSCEALLRWHSPSRGNVLPGDFIPFAEQNGLMAEIDAWVLRAACKEAAGWPDQIRVSINLSSSHFYQSSLVESIVVVLADTGLPAARLELEVTETAMISDIEAAAAVLERLRTLGISIALDDFGTGYSSLSFLRTLPFDRVKIDRSFVKDLGLKPEASAIIDGMIHLCIGMGAAVTAEGVETSRQIELLQASGCREVQGFGIGVPVSANQIQTWFKAFARSRTHVDAAAD